MIDIQARLQHAAESILENEALSADLDDEAAKVLLDWGVALAQQIVSETIEMDDAAAEDATYQPMRALRKMLRAINNWASQPDPAGLEKIVLLAKTVYPGGIYISDTLALQILPENDPVMAIANLRAALDTATTDPGHTTALHQDF